jgi:large subunit ribosomal protein L18
MKTKFANPRKHRHARVRTRVAGTSERPRLAVFRSNRYIYAQLIDDKAGATLAMADSRELRKGKQGPSTTLGAGKRATDVGFTKVPEAYQVGKLLAEKAVAKKVKRVAFDRGGYLYAGRVRAVAEGAREGGLEF